MIWPHTVALIEEAETCGDWIFLQHEPDVWFTPAELRAEQAKGKFCWGVQNFGTMPPSILLAGLRAEIRTREATLKAWEAKLP